MKGQTQNLDPDLESILKELEDHMGFELTITSGYRSGAHNIDVGGVPNSEHTYLPAMGADVLCKQSLTRFQMLQWLFRYQVKRIGIGKDFLHIGIADDKPHPACWTYYEEPKGDGPTPV